MAQIEALNSIARTRQILSCCRSTIYKLHHEGKLELRRLGGRTVVTGESLKAFIESLPTLRPRQLE
jgi:hypothetical protein